MRPPKPNTSAGLCHGDGMEGPRIQVSHPLPDLGHDTTRPCLHRSTLRELEVSPAGTNRHWTCQKGISHFLSFTASATLKRISIHRRARGMIVIVSLERILGNRNMSNSKEYKEKIEKPHPSPLKSKMVKLLQIYLLNIIH